MKILALFLFFSLPAAAQEVALSLVDGGGREGQRPGLLLETALGRFTLALPKLVTAASGSEGERAEVTESSSSSLLARYPSGARVVLRIEDSGSVSCSLDGAPADAREMLFSLSVRRESVEGGTLSVGEKSASVPEDGDKLVLISSVAGPLTIEDATGAGLRITIPKSVGTILDLRPAGQDEFSCRISRPATGSETRFPLGIEFVRPE
jgi:hypothetical protein